MVTLTPWTEELIHSGERWAERDWRNEPQSSRFDTEQQNEENEERSK